MENSVRPGTVSSEEWSIISSSDIDERSTTSSISDDFNDSHDDEALTSSSRDETNSGALSPLLQVNEASEPNGKNGVPESIGSNEASQESSGNDDALTPSSQEESTGNDDSAGSDGLDRDVDSTIELLRPPVHGQASKNQKSRESNSNERVLVSRAVDASVTNVNGGPINPPNSPLRASSDFAECFENVCSYVVQALDAQCRKLSVKFYNCCLRDNVSRVKLSLAEPTDEGANQDEKSNDKVDEDLRSLKRSLYVLVDDFEMRKETLLYRTLMVFLMYFVMSWLNSVYFAPSPPKPETFGDKAWKWCDSVVYTSTPVTSKSKLSILGFNTAPKTAKSIRFSSQLATFKDTTKTYYGKFLLPASKKYSWKALNFYKVARGKSEICARTLWLHSKVHASVWFSQSKRLSSVWASQLSQRASVGSEILGEKLGKFSQLAESCFNKSATHTSKTSLLVYKQFRKTALYTAKAGQNLLRDARERL